MEENKTEKENVLPENFNDLLLTLKILQGIMVLVIPLFIYLYKENFLFFLPLLLIIVYRFKKIKEVIITGTTSKILVDSIIQTSLLMGVIWIVETITYVLIISMG